MTLPVWPASVPHKVASDSFQGAAPTPNPLVTTFEDGNQRSRPRSLTSFTEMSFDIIMANAEYGVLEDFVKNTLGNQAARFRMPIFKPATGDYAEREVRLVTGLPLPRPHVEGFLRVSLRVNVKNY
jgi:hypothetical protein